VIGETIGVIRPTISTDRRGDAVLTYATTATHEVTGVAVEPRESREINDGRSAGTVVSLNLYIPSGADIEPTDRILVRSETFEADGEMADWRHPMASGVGGLVLAVKKVEG